MHQRQIFHNIAELYTLEPLAKVNRLTSIKIDDLGRLVDASMLVENGIIKATHAGKPPADWQKQQNNLVDLRGQIVLPGFIDSHTHPVFSGYREDEFNLRISGATYQDIAKNGGGIQSSVRTTRQASVKELTGNCERHAQRMLAHGTTTVEMKSGYGLSIKDELKSLQAIADAKTPQAKIATCLALHAVPYDAASKEAFIKQMTDELLPEVQAQNLATWVDAFVEKGYFEPSQVRSYFSRAQDLGFGVRLHADEFSHSHAAELACDLKAASADHLQYASDKAIATMAENNIVATLLPGTSLFTKIPFAQGKRFTQRKCPVALASDFNPGSSRFMNLSQLATFAALYSELNLAEIVAGITYVPAFSLRVHERKGSLSEGFDADFVVFDHQNIEQWFSDMGQTNPSSVWIKGNKVI